MIVDDKMISPYGRTHIAHFPQKAVKPVNPSATVQHARIVPREHGGQPNAEKDGSRAAVPQRTAKRHLTVPEQRYSELLDKEKRLQQLENLLGKLCVFSVSDMKDGRIRYKARISKKEAERLLHDQLQHRAASLSPSLPPMKDHYLVFQLAQIEVTD